MDLRIKVINKIIIKVLRAVGVLSLVEEATLAAEWIWICCSINGHSGPQRCLTDTSLMSRWARGKNKD